MDHGIELPSRRIEKGKPETGIITVTYGIENGTMFITIFNDGETLNLKTSFVTRTIYTYSKKRENFISRLKWQH